MLNAETVETGTNPQHCVIWLHGLGADGNDFVPVIPHLQLNDSTAVRFIFPHAPQMPVTINSGFVMRAWYDIAGADLTARQDQAGIINSEKLLSEIVAQQMESGINEQNIVLAGFSQGGAMALHSGLRGQYKLAGIMALSCYLPLMDESPLPAAEGRHVPPIFMAHGNYDPIVPLDAGVQSRRYLESLGYPVQWHDYPMDHSVCDEEIRDIGKWLNSLFSSE